MNISKINKIFNTTYCISSQEMINYLDGNLSEKDKNRIEIHLLSCQMCKDQFEGIAGMKNHQELDQIVLDLNLKIDKKVHQKSTKVVFFRKNFLQIAAVALILIGSTFFINNFIRTSTKELQSTESISQNVENKEDTMNNFVKVEESAKEIEQPTTVEQEFQKKNEINRTAEEAVLESMDEKKLEVDFDKSESETEKDIAFDEEIIENELVVNEKNVNKEPEIKSINAVSIEDKQEINKSKILGNAVSTEMAKEKNNSEKNKKTGNIFFTNRKLNRAKTSKKDENLISEKKNAGKKVEENLSADYSDNVVSQSQSILFFNKGVKNFEENNYKSAEDNFKQSIKYQQDNTKAIYYLALTNYTQNNKNKAIDNLNEVLKFENCAYFIDALWLKANILMEMGKRKSAINILNDIYQNNGKYSIDAKLKLDSLKVD